MIEIAGQKRDLVALVADNDIKAVLLALLRRPQDLGIHPIAILPRDVPVHYRHDSGCLREAEGFLRPFHPEYRYALVVFDYSGCGKESDPVETVEEKVRTMLSRSGWNNRCAAVAIDPEIEAWIWIDSPEVEQSLGWPSRRGNLRTWLQNRSAWLPRRTKPSDPKRAYQLTLKQMRRPHSPAVFESLAGKVTFTGCSDRAFCKLKNVLQTWFPPEKGI